MSRSPSAVSLGDPAKVRLDDSGRTRAFFCRSEPARVDRALVAELKAAAAPGRRNVRLCLHPDPAAPFHQMVILEHKGSYYRPHKHLAKGESYHVIEGEMGAFVFDDAGSLLDACRLSPGGTFMYRVGAGTFHAVLPLTDLVVYHECKPGPFVRDGDSVWADWAPDGRDPAAAEAFAARLLRALGDG